MRRAPSRYELLPRWIRAFSWLVLGVALLVPLAYLIGDPMGEGVSYKVLGFDYDGSPTGFEALAILAIIVGMGVAAFGLLWGTSWGLEAGLAAGWLGLFVVIVNAYFSLQGPSVTLPLEPLLQIPFIISLYRKRDSWAEADHAAAA